jgi:hypothetical protein
MKKRFLAIQIKKQEEMLDAMSERNGMCVSKEFLPQSRAVL